jgi:hypothetical protein
MSDTRIVYAPWPTPGARKKPLAAPEPVRIVTAQKEGGMPTGTF